LSEDARLLCIQFGWRDPKTKVIISHVIPLWHRMNTAYNPSVAWKMIAPVLLSKGIKKVFQNGKFDILYIYFTTGVRCQGIELDTMLMLHALSSGEQGCYGLKAAIGDWAVDLGITGYEKLLPSLTKPPSIQSCGCLQKELASKRLVTHGRSNSKTYRSWAAMKARCYNPLHHAYENYGGRGISVDPTWLTSFQTFVEDMGERPSNTTLDRIDNESGYSKVNCRWATKVEQGNNTRCNVVLEFQGESKTATEWAKDLNISYYALIKRISDYKWSVERALTTPLQKRTKRGS
jgi:hypothetical protein